MKTSKVTLQAIMLLLLLGFLTEHSLGQPLIPATEAKYHVGENATVYGKVWRVFIEDGKYEKAGAGYRQVTPIFLYVRGYDSNRVFSIVLMDGNDNYFKRLKDFEGKVIAVSGQIQTNRMGLPRISINSTWDVVNINSDFEALTQQQTNQSVASVKETAPIPQMVAPTNEAPVKKHFVFSVDADATNTIVTTSGMVYHRAKVVLAEPDGLSIKYVPDGAENGCGYGAIKIPFSELSAEYQRAYNYTPQRAARYAEINRQIAALAQLEKAANEQQQQQEKAAYARKKYEQSKEDFDVLIKLGTLEALQRSADAQAQQAQELSHQSFIKQMDLIDRSFNQSETLLELQNQTYQQKRTADTLDDIYWQNRLR